MSSLIPASTGSGLQFGLFGFPVTISWSILLLLAFLGFQTSPDPVGIALFVVIGVVSILVHELAHAVTARWAGASPRIRLAGLGGVTSYRQSDRTRQRSWSLLISVSGPLVGVAIGIAALLLGAPWPLGGARIGSTAELAGALVVFTSLGWGVLNLLPILPLDGGQAMAQLLPGSPGQRLLLAARISVGVGAVVVLAAIAAQQTFAAIIVGLMTYQNVQALSGSKRNQELGALVAEGRFGDARRRLELGEGSPEQLDQLQRAAMEAGQHQTAAEVGETALTRGWEDPEYAINAARSWAVLGADDRAFRLLGRALSMDGVTTETLSGIPELQRLRADDRWAGLGTPPVG